MVTSAVTVTPQKVLALAQSLSSDDLQWLIEQLHQFTEASPLPEKVTIEEAIHLYQTEQYSLGKAAELAGITRWQLQEILYQRGTPATLGSNLTLDEIDGMVDLLEAEYAGRE